MMTRLATFIAALMLVGTAAIAQADEALEKAIALHESGKITDCDRQDCKSAMALVKKDLKGCLRFYNPTECQGPAQTWVQNWEKLQVPLFSATDRTARPSFWGLHVPFTKSRTDYLTEHPG